jgi:phenylacetate-coenzyme A ligase PaaK-like adenylate-forming protein
MSLRKIVAKQLARRARKRINNWAANPIETQQRVFNQLIKKAKQTAFGKDHSFDQIKNHKDFIKRVPITDYEGLRTYVDRVVAGESDVLWPGKPLYFAKTSGTTSGTKYIPLTRESMPTHIEAAKNALFCHIEATGDASFVNGKMIFLQGSPVLEQKSGIALGRLSGIVAHYVPKYLQKNRLPSWKTNCIEDWEIKVEAIVEETHDQDMRLISGIPPWVSMYYEKLVAKTGMKAGELFPNFSLFVYGGVNFEPYRTKLENLVGRPVPSVELYPASEGFFAFQDQPDSNGMLLQLNSGIFYEFIPSDQFFDESPHRLGLSEVKVGVNYVIIISTNSGLWGYNIGDTVMFTSTSPYRVVVSGRIKHFISAFGEHVIGKEVEQALLLTVKNKDVEISEFTVAPQVNPENGLPYHEWFIEFTTTPKDMAQFCLDLDLQLCIQNSYYQDLIVGKVLRPLEIQVVEKGGFSRYMKRIGKLGGQNKVPRLTNDRKIADELISECQ